MQLGSIGLVCSQAPGQHPKHCERKKTCNNRDIFKESSVHVVKKAIAETQAQKLACVRDIDPRLERELIGTVNVYKLTSKNRVRKPRETQKNMLNDATKLSVEWRGNCDRGSGGSGE
ncbi:hypothetical protein K435DRAFT_813395 [Dendrothele bispora CBS 962.96]|uniref:Uncharacterized protein n=1 Tax=Dendrothele bispora (strain CBS 962.96) TaxID=1314807 RepID=A0A4S8KLQ4_DENBC|nr:hypothetical protein K435DRAFT_813395 [Dendrothele bispora CBS 962.96]